MDQAMPHVAGDIAAGRAKNKHVPCCRWRVGPVILINAWLGTDRVPPVNDTSYAVVDSTGDSAAGRAEDFMLFHKIVALCATIL